MKQADKKATNRRTYEKPALKVVHEKELLELLGPAQGYGHLSPDTEWLGG